MHTHDYFSIQCTFAHHCFKNEPSLISLYFPQRRLTLILKEKENLTEEEKAALLKKVHLYISTLLDIT